MKRQQPYVAKEKKQPYKKKKKTYLDQSLGPLIEMKNHESEQNLFFSTGSPAFTISTSLNGITPGDTAETRTGRKITMKKLYLNWMAYLAPASTGGSPLRVKIVYDKQTNKDSPFVVDILTDSFLSFNNLDNSQRFITLCDFITEPLSENGNFCVAGKKSIKMNLDTMYTATGGTVGSITTGSIFLLVSHTGFVSTAAPAFAFKSRIRYIDA